MSTLEPRRADVEYVEQTCQSALNPVRGMGFRWSLNPYVGCEHRCAFCYVRGFERRADRASDHRYGQTVRVKVNIPTVLRRELARPSWNHETVAFGTATDPYQPAEGRYRLTRQCLQALADFVTPVGLITRGPMVVRDMDVLVGLAGRADLTITFSVPTVDAEIWRRTEPGTAPPQQRLKALSRLVAAGLRAGIGMAPLLPGLSDRPEQIEAVVRAAREAGATHLWASMLNLRPGTREHFMECLARYWPELVPDYESHFAGRGYLPRRLTDPSLRLVSEVRERVRIADRRRFRIVPLPPVTQLALPLPTPSGGRQTGR